MSKIKIPKKQLEELLNRHALKAQSSSYDRGVCVLAVSTVRERLLTLTEDLQGCIDLEDAISQIAELAQQYSDPDGQYTSGKSVVIGLLDDLYCLKFEQEESPDSSSP